MRSNDMEIVSKLIEDAEAWLAEGGISYGLSQMKELRLQYSQQRWHIAFCGHFSAGKSSLINALCGRPLLPSGPIPTTANIIRIQQSESGEERLTLYQRDESENLKAVSSINGNFDQMREFTTEETVYDLVKVEAPLPEWGDHVVFIDTPGADSTDERHHQATARALPLADLVLYVTDYNHVLSEVNMMALQQLQQMGKWFVFIVNQIDKHKEQEVPFQTFKSTVEEGLNDWNVRPEHIWYVSTKEPDHPLSEWHALKSWLHQLTTHSPIHLAWSGLQSMRAIVHAHQIDEEQKIQLEKDALQEANQEISFEEFAAQMKKYKQQISEAEAMPDKKRDELRQEISKLLANANIIPATTRDLAHDFLQSQQPGYKKGWLFAKKKTMQEQERLLSIFHKAFQENVHTQAEWHVKELLRQALAACKYIDADAAEELEKLQFDITPEWLKEQIQPGAVFSNEYTMNYMKLVSESVKTMIRQKSFAFIERLYQGWEQESHHAVQMLKEELERGRSKTEVYEKWLDLDQRLDRLQQNAARFLNGFSLAKPELPNKPALEGKDAKDAKDAITEAEEAGAQADTAGQTEWRQGADEAAAAMELGTETSSERIGSMDREVQQQTRYVWNEQNKKTADRLMSAAALIESLPGMADLAASMRSRGERLRNSQFTAALFGAFSAGKSSFANALTGRSILAVSPHPTTAAITRIAAPNEQFSHGTAAVHLKSERQLEEEISQALSHMGLNEGGHIRAADWMERKLPEAAQNEGARRARTFLASLQGGWPEMKEKLGQTLIADMEQFRLFSAEERYSAYVESIDVHYSSPLTDAGVILVDTPGADSLNARHTGVAFEYIKNADAVLFVTYYNHAFTQADRMFLEQLSGVKDQFSMDKMFFIVNAADLASGPDELEQVLQHVKMNLEKSEIRNPHLYPISSIQALAAKESGDARLLQQSGMAQFEKDWLHFMQEEMAAVSKHAADHEIARAIHLLEEWIKETEEQEQEKQQKSMGWKKAKAEAVQLFESAETDWIFDRLDRELRELMFYVKQRVQFRFGDWFKSSFHPSALSASAKENIRIALTAAANECYHLINQGCLQEALATSLRMEKYLMKQLEKWDADCMEQLDPLYESFEHKLDLEEDWETPSLEMRMEQPDIDQRWLLKHFNHAKQFFEQGGRDQMRAEMEKLCMVSVDAFIDRLTEQMKDHYASQLAEKISAWKSARIARLSSFADGWIEMLEKPMNKETLEELKSKLERL